MTPMSPTGSLTRLSLEKSPYLLQHANNPVDWYPWGDEAFEKARGEDKPIFLSIGYSTCYWCHVMEREVFENEQIAGLMNQTVVSIKVDREERPDIDRIYMSALQAMSGSGGWPMSMFLTPDRKPFFGATYIPPTARHGRPGFVEILERIGELWKTERDKIIESGSRLGDYLSHMGETQGDSAQPTEEVLSAGFEYLARTFDERHGGFGGAPKFPRPVTLNFLHRFFAGTRNPRALEFSLTTLRHMANGGLFDHLGGGFHRYSTDGRWHVPHFEKMLYDQAQLSISYLEAFQITHDTFYGDIAKRTLAYVLRDLSSPRGGFTSAEDAESVVPSDLRRHKEEGAFYVWTQADVEGILTKEEALVACRVFDIQEHGNVLEDPHGVFREKNVLHVTVPISDVALQIDLPEPTIVELLESAMKKLLSARTQRPRPHLDDKILTSWNGLMISAFSRAYQVFRAPAYLRAAEDAASFILATLRDRSTKELFHRYREGESGIEGHLEDYAFLIQGLLDLYEACFEITHLDEAIALQETQIGLFLDHERGGFYDTSGRDKTVLVRTKEWYDGAEPSGNAVAILNLLRLAQITSKESYQTTALKSLSWFGPRMIEAPQAAPQFLIGLAFALTKPAQIIIAGKRDDGPTDSLLAAVHEHFLPHRILMLADGGLGQERLARFTAFIATLSRINDLPTAYLCENFACRLPTTDPAELSEQLRAFVPTE